MRIELGGKHNNVYIINERRIPFPVSQQHLTHQIKKGKPNCKLNIHRFIKDIKF